MTKEDIQKEAEKQISEWLGGSTEREKEHYRIGFRRSFEYIVRRRSEQLVICKKCGSSEMYQYTKTKDKCEECGNIQDC